MTTELDWEGLNVAGVLVGFGGYGLAQANALTIAKIRVK